MLTGGVSPLASNAATFNPVLAAKSNAGSQGGITKSTNSTRSAAEGNGNAVSPNDTQSAHGIPKSDSSQSNSAAPAAPATTINALNAIVSGYSTTVGGTQYLASLERSGSEYTASVQSLLGATSTESSELAAENDLNVRIDELV